VRSCGLQCRRRAGLRRQGDERDRRGARAQGLASVKVRASLAALIAIVVAACSAGGVATPSPSATSRASQLAESPSAGASSVPSVPPAALTIFAAASAQGARAG